MSFLYEALLKKDRQNDHPSNPQGAAIPQGTSMSQGTAMPGMFADEGKSSSPVALWIALAIALLIIGVLAGYILGQQNTSQPIQYVEKQPELILPQSQPETVEVTSTPVQNPVTANADIVSQPQDMRTAVSVEQQPEEIEQIDEMEEKQFTVSVDPNGVVQSSVIEPEVEEVSEQNYLSANDQDVMDLEQVPENLRESFQLAVEATSEQNEDTSFQSSAPQIMNSSSLRDIAELSDTDRAGLPPILYQMHIYASNKTDRWVKLNDRIMTEGEEFMPGLKLLEIRQDIIVWETRYNRFSQNALEDYSAL